MKYISIMFIFMVFTAGYSQKLGRHTLEEWQTIIDTTWGEGLSTATKLDYFDEAWNTIDNYYAGFQNLDIDWDAMKETYRPEVEAGVSRGRFAAIMTYMSWALLETHAIILDSGVSWETTLDPGIPLFLTGQPGRATHFGAALSPLADSSLLVIKVLPDHPLGLVPGDVIVGYNGKSWKDLYKEILQAQLPLSHTGNPVSTKKAQTHNYLINAGMNWHLFDTLDVIKYTSGETVHYPTNLLAGQKGFIWANEQLPVPGVPWPAVNQGDNIRFNRELGDFISWGIIENTQIGYIYLLSTSKDLQPDLGLKFSSAIDSMMNYYATTGLIIDLRLNIGGNISMPASGLAMLFNSYIKTAAFSRRCGDHFDMCPDNSVPIDILDIKGDPNTFYDRPIAVLIGPGSQSMGDFLPLMMKFHPMVRLFGKPSAGAFSKLDGNFQHLPDKINWWFAYTDGNSFLLSDPDNYLTHTELPVDEEVWLTQEDVAKGEDTVVKRAMEWIQNLSYAHDVAVDKSYVKPVSGIAEIAAEVENPNHHNLSVLAYISLDDTTIIDSIYLAENGDIWSAPWTTEEENIYQVSVKTDDPDAGTSRTIPNVSRLTSSGPVVIDSIYVTGTDTIPNPGDPYIKYELFLKNEGAVKTIKNVTINPVFLDPCTQQAGLSLPVFGDIAPGETKKGSRSLGINFEDSCQGGPITFALEIKSDDFIFWTDTFQVDVVSGLENDKSVLPKVYALHQNYPNPFNPSTTISYQLPMISDVNLTIYNILGQKVITLVDKRQPAGSYEVKWDASQFSSGVYLYSLRAGDYRDMKKLVLLK